MSQELTVQEAAKARRSIRRYTDEPISEATVRELIEIAGLAPSPWNLQPWRIGVALDHDLKQKLMEAAYGQPQVGAAAAVFAIGSDMLDVLANVEETIHPGMADRAEQVAKSIRDHFAGYSEADLHWWGRAQCYSFMSFLLLAAQSKGYATSAMLGFDPAKVREIWGWPDRVQVAALVAMGRPAEDGFPHHRCACDRLAEIR